MTVEEMRKVVFEKRPRFKQTIDVWGTKTLLDYYTQDFKNLGTPSDDFLSAFAKEAQRYFSDEIVADAVSALTTQKWVNTADHHGLLCHPYFYTVALARSHKRVRGLDNVTVTLPFSCISLSNDSFPRGLFFHDAEGTIQKIIFKTLKEKRLPVYALPPLTKEAFEKDIATVEYFKLSDVSRKRLTDFLYALLLHNTLWDQPSYSAQLTVMNTVLWRSLFGEERGEFVYLPIEDVVVRLLLEKHLIQKTTLHKALFEKEWRESFVALFYPESEKAKGTEFFWFIDYKNNVSRPLTLSGDTLTTHEGDMCFELTPETIVEGLRKKTLMPSTTLMMILLQGEESAACGGGPNQLEYLAEYMSKWEQFCSEHGLSTSIPNTQIWCEANTLFHVKNKEGHCEPATLFDVLLHTDNPLLFIDEALETTSTNTAVDTLIPTFYYLYTKVKIAVTEKLMTREVDVRR